MSAVKRYIWHLPNRKTTREAGGFLAPNLADEWPLIVGRWPHMRHDDNESPSRLAIFNDRACLHVVTDDWPDENPFECPAGSLLDAIKTGGEVEVIRSDELVVAGRQVSWRPVVGSYGIPRPREAPVIDPDGAPSAAVALVGRYAEWVLGREFAAGYDQDGFVVIWGSLFPQLKPESRLVGRGGVPTAPGRIIIGDAPWVSGMRRGLWVRTGPLETFTALVEKTSADLPTGATAALRLAETSRPGASTKAADLKRHLKKTKNAETYGAPTKEVMRAVDRAGSRTLLAGSGAIGARLVYDLAPGYRVVCEVARG